jgi:hypothetical protein
VASLRSSLSPASTPVGSLPWMLQLMNTGMRKSPPLCSMLPAAVGSRSMRRKKDS